MTETIDIATSASSLTDAVSDGLSFETILGAAGTGKSTLLRERAADDPNYAKVTASTGIAAVNLGPGVTTVHSALGFYNAESAFEALEHGRLARRFADLAEQGFKNLVIDEVSMMPADVLTAISLGCAQGAERVQQLNSREGKALVPCGVILTGDFLQLPPVNAPFAFTSPVWPCYEANIVRLDKVYRQTNPAFLEALQAARAGRGTTAVMKLSECGVKFVSERDDFFDGTSLVPTNDMANKINAARYAEIAGDERLYKSTRWGKESGEWKDIPEQLGMKAGALVMVLANEPRTFGYVNGDTGIVVEMAGAAVVVEIRRGQKKHVREIPYVWRETTQRDEPEQAVKYEGVSIDGTVFRLPREIETKHKEETAALMESGNESEIAKALVEKTRARRFARFFEFYDAYVADAIKRRVPFYSVDKQKWVVGWIEYMPLRLAYASTVHKCLYKDTLVYDKYRGVIPISRVEVGRRLWTGKNWAKVKAIVQSNKPAVRIRTVSGYETTCSAEHRFPVAVADGNHRYMVEAQALLSYNESLLLAGWKLPNMRMDHNEDLAYLAGLLVGDGSYTDSKEGNVHFCCRDSFLQGEFRRIVEERLEIHAGTRADKKGSFFTSKPVRQRMAEWGFDYVKGPEKQIPWGLITSTLAARAFIRGLMDTDGSVFKSGVVFCTSSLRLSRQVQMLLLALEIKSVRAEYPGVERPYYQLRVGAAALEVYRELIGFKRPRKVEKLAKCKPNRVILWPPDYEQVVAVDDLQIDAEMYDIELEKDPNLFSADGLLTHNSQGLTLNNLQIDARNRFAGSPGMMYVALSRCRTPENIRVVANIGDFAKRIQTATECLRWV